MNDPNFVLTGSLFSILPMGVAMLVLIGISGMLSGSEAAFFSLSTRDRLKLSKSGFAGKLADRLLDDPERLLSAILFWNLMVNMTYFALATIIASKMGHPTAAVIISTGSLLAIIFFSEMLPKSLAMQSPVRATLLLATPISWFVLVVSPLLPTIGAANQVVCRLVWPTLTSEPDLDLEDIQRAIELGTGDAAMLQRERGAMRGLLGLADVRAAEWMRPRNRCRVVPAEDAPEATLDCSEDDDDAAAYVLVQDGEDDLVTRSIMPRYLRPSQIDSPRDIGSPVVYVPWSAQVSQVLDALHGENRDVAIVLDEFGSWLGSITIDDILQRVLVPERSIVGDGNIQSVSPESGADPVRWRVSGGESLRTVAKQIGVEIEVEGVSTIAGYVQRQNGRFPRLGDQAMLGRYCCEVIEQDEDQTQIEVYIDQEMDDAESL